MIARATLLGVVLCAPICAQSASSRNFFLPAGEVASGGSCATTKFALTASFGSGVVAAAAKSRNFALAGGFTAALDVRATGRPWLTGTTPLYAAMRSGRALRLHGTELDLGRQPTVTIAGRPASVTSRRNDAIATALPNPSPPGYQPVEVKHSLGTVTLPQGIGVLPLVEATPLAADVAGELIYRGTPGDRMVWAISLARSPSRLPLPPFHWGLELDLATIVVTPAQTVRRSDGTLRLPIPALSSVQPIWVQAFAISADPGYAPGAFTNAMRVF